MAKKKQRRSANKSVAAVPTTAEVKAKASQAAAPKKHPSTRGGRETVEALVIAFVLAFFIRTFQAEPFVIPTGSMAPTLMGVHKDVFCDQCGERFRVNASAEVGDEAIAIRAAVAKKHLSPSEGRRRIESIQTVGGVCPQCRYVQPIRSDGLESDLMEGVDPVTTKPCYSGDRLVVNKYAYSFADPERWDIIVFKYPGNGQMNYIKRLVGLPGEKLRLHNGDLFTSQGNEQPYKIARKPPSKMLAMRHVVYDSAREPASLHAAGWPLRWRAESSDWRIAPKAIGNGETVSPRYQVDGSDSTATQWLRYHHTPPGEPVWQQVLSGEENPAYDPKPGLITDFIAYNTRMTRARVAGQKQYTLTPMRENDLSHLGLHWVGDLMVEADVQIESAQGKLLLELVEAGTHYGCEVDIASGEATLWRREFEATERETLDTAATPIRGPGSHELRLANFDDQLVLWVDGEVIPLEGQYGHEKTFDNRYATLPQTSDADAGDLAPASIGSQGAKLTVDALRLWRDIYYLADDWKRKNRTFVTDFDIQKLSEERGRQGLSQLVGLSTTPESWDILTSRRHVDFELAEDQFFVMGDNSPESLDARLWAGGNGHDRGKPGGAYLERHLLVGKAVCVYWPHSWYTLPLTGGRVPIWPNFGDMRLVR